MFPFKKVVFGKITGNVTTSVYAGGGGGYYCIDEFDLGYDYHFSLNKSL